MHSHIKDAQSSPSGLLSRKAVLLILPCLVSLLGEYEEAQVPSLFSLLQKMNWEHTTQEQHAPRSASSRLPPRRRCAGAAGRARLLSDAAAPAWSPCGRREPSAEPRLVAKPAGAVLEATHRANRRLCARGASSRWVAQPASAGGRTRRCRGPGSRRSSGGNGARVGAGGLFAGLGCLSISAVSGKGGGGRAGRRGLRRAEAGTCAQDL